MHVPRHQLFLLLYQFVNKQANERKPRSKGVSAYRLLGFLALSTNDVLPPRDVIPDDVAVQLAAGGEEDAPPGQLGYLVGETHVFRRLVPACQEEDIDR